MQAAALVLRVADGVWRLTTPLPFRPREVHAYLLQVEEGAFVLVDGGANTDDAWAALDAGVQEVAGQWQRVTAHVVTHMHLDHFGLARRVHEASRAPLLMHRLDAERAAHAEAQPEEEADYRQELLRQSGAPEELILAVTAGREEAVPLTGFVAADVLLEGEAGALPGVEGWQFVWTPGHTAGHLSLFRAADRVLVAGDAVLPRITPTIGVNRQRSDPVGDYLDALQRLERLNPTLGVAGHDELIKDPPERLRELRDATQQENKRVDDCLAEDAVSAWEIVRRRYPGRELPPSVQMLALRETLAHLQHLVLSERARSVRLGDEIVGFAREQVRGGPAPRHL
ncbi:MBL fold metallo-hydrolase [soil metagenome]